MSTTLVVGSSGQDGAYLVERWVAAGGKVHATSRGDQREPSPALALRNDGAEDGDALTAIAQETEPDVVFSLAVVSSVATLWKEPMHAGVVSAIAIVVLLVARIREQEVTGRTICSNDLPQRRIATNSGHSQREVEG